MDAFLCEPDKLARKRVRIPGWTFFFAGNEEGMVMVCLQKY